MQTEYADMHALPPPRKVILRVRFYKPSHDRLRWHESNSQIGINSRNMSIRNWFWQRSWPSFRLPFIRIWSPHFRTPVGSKNPNYDVGIVWDRHFSNLPSIQSFDWGWKRKEDILSGTILNRIWSVTGNIVINKWINVRPLHLGKGRMTALL